MKIARQGYRFVIGGLAAGAACFAAGPMGWGPGVIAVLFAGFCAYFFRDPDRPAPQDPALLYSPGDGRVLSVAREGPGPVTTIRIFLSIFDVHVQRIPCSGTVEKVLYQKGGFLMAMRPEAAQNERSIVRLKPGGGREPILVEQIAGLVARRIETWCREGDAVDAGARYGIIYFGSQAAVHLPAGTESLVKPGDRVEGGLTPIARWTA
ncbi:MAG: phosphatidylserine decarboxylase [Elusimicrobia bacterium]|nr:phosphatidylserine decarboxylase [Elusimicrobiota bacterium]